MTKLTIETTYSNDVKGIARLPRYEESKDESVFIADVASADVIHRIGYQEDGEWVGTQYLVTVNEDLTYGFYNLSEHVLLYHGDTIALGWPDIINDLNKY